VSIAALFRCLVAATVRRPRAGTRHTTHTRRIIDENRWRAKRDGLGAQFIAEASSEVLSVPEMLEAARLFIAEEADQLECATALDGLHTILHRGTSAHRQLKLYNDARAAGASRSEALRQVLAWLAAATLQKPPTALPISLEAVLPSISSPT
jgi:carboxylate-amine ligase